MSIKSAGQAALPDSRVLLENGIKHYEEGRYKDALQEFLKVHEGDTSYAIAKYEIALTYLADSSYEKARQTALEGLELPDGNPREFSMTLGHAYDYLKKPDSAIAVYRRLQQQNADDHQPVFEEGVVYLRKKEYDKALELMQQSLLVNPYHYRSHLMLGSTYMLQGRLTEAYIALLVSLLTSNDINVARSSILMLDALAKQTEDANKAYQNKEEKYKHPLYDEIDQIINARLASNKAYKVESVLADDNMVRVSHAIMEKLQYDKDDKNFVMQYYVPLLREVYKEGMFDPFMLLLFSGYNIEAVDKYVKKQKGDMKDVKIITFPYLNKILATRVLPYQERIKAKEKHSIDLASNVYYTGNFETKNNETKVRAGHARLYKRGSLVAEGNYNNEGNKQGEWKYYYTTGVVRLTEQYTNGKVTGEVKKYGTAGQLQYAAKYDANEEMVERREYTHSGILTDVTVVKPKNEKVATSYHANGKEELSLTIRDQKVVDGQYKDYHANGTVSRDLQISGGKMNGPYKEYYDNGVVKESGTYLKGEKHGEFRTFNEDGKPAYVMNYEDGKLDGPYEEYDEKGNLSITGAYKNGRKNGISRFIDKGREYGIVEYKNDAPVSFRFVEEKGKVAGEDKGDLKALRIYFANGALRSDIPLKDGAFEGEAKFYYSTGALREKTTYNGGLAEGWSIVYYKNGRISSKTYYVKDEKTGEYMGYHENGKLSTTGWMLNGSKEGKWQTYDAAGQLVSESHFLNDELNGPYKQYVNNKPDYTDLYSKGMLIGMKQYDTTGLILNAARFAAGNGQYKLVFPDGSTYFEAPLKNGLYNGKLNKYYPGGKSMEQGFFYMGSRDSTSVSYFFSGRVSAKGKYRNGGRDGVWQYFTEDGVLARETNYRKGNEHGKDLVYMNGQLHIEYDMVNDYIEGDVIYYGENNAVACVLKYENRDLVGYTYPGKDGKLLPVVPIKNGTATVTSYYPNGKKSAEFNFEQGRLAGKQVTYYTNGQIAEERSLENLDYNGPYKRYYEDGKLLYEAYYKDDQLTGAEVHYNKDGDVVKSYNYENDDLHGVQVVQDAQAPKTTTIYYYHGRPVSAVK